MYMYLHFPNIATLNVKITLEIQGFDVVQWLACQKSSVDDCLISVE